MSLLMKTKMRVLVTGASGFIGQTVVGILANGGHDVIALYRERELPTALQNMCLDAIRGDICDKSLSSKLFPSIDVVCHLAAFIPTNYSDINNAEKCYQTNALATLNLVSGAVAHKVSRFIYISTGNMYGFSDSIATENDPVFPSGVAAPYFVSKLAGEIYTSHVCQSSTMTGIILRVGTPYGPGEPKNKVIPSFLTQAILGNQLNIYQGGKPSYNFVYVEDVAVCVEKAIKRGESGIYNVSSGESTSLKEVAETIASIFSDRQLKINIEPPTLNIALGFPPISIAKATSVWDYKPLNLKDGLHKYLEIIQNENIIK